MKIQRLFLRNVRNIKELDLDFRDPVTGKPMSRIVLAGANGSGKTTILECIFELIRSLGSSKLDAPYLEQGTGNARLTLQPTKTSKGQWVILFNMAPTVEERRGSYLSWQYYGDERRFERETDGDIHEVFSGNPELSDQFFAGTSLLYLPDNRRPLSTMSGPITPEEESLWAYRYIPTDQWKGSVESYLVWQNYLDLEDRDKGLKADRFQQVTGSANHILDRKRIVGVERGRVIVEVKGKLKHGLDDLSSGERQLVLLLVEISRHIKPGSLILIDEPEISLHPAWQRGLMAALDKIIEQYDAQVILATHSLEIATSVMPYEVISLNDLGLPLGKWEPEKEALA